MMKTNYRYDIHRNGMSLVELMVALAIGSFLMLGLVSTFRNSSEAQRELEKSNQLIENGRYALDLIFQDLRLAGYYGFYYSASTAPSALPDPCATSAASLEAALNVPVQGYAAANISTIADISHTNTCETALLTNANLKPGSDILVIRRLDTAVLQGAAPVANEVYLQANVNTFAIQVGNSSAGTIDANDVDSYTANNVVQSLPKYPPAPTPASQGDDPEDVVYDDWADTRKFHVHVYFVAPCRYGSGTNGVCQNGDDDVPTLKRLELGPGPAMSIMPIVDGIEFLKFRYGIDDTPSAVNLATGAPGDGITDGYVTAPTLAQTPNITTVSATLLARTLDESRGYEDAKVYDIAGMAYDPDPTDSVADDAYKRHVYTTVIHLMNVAGRREIP